MEVLPEFRVSRDRASGFVPTPNDHTNSIGHFCVGFRPEFNFLSNYSQSLKYLAESQSTNPIAPREFL